VTGYPVVPVTWRAAVRIIRSLYPPIDLFEDIADPADWPLLLSAEQKTNPRVLGAVGRLDLVPAKRSVSGPGASYLMSPFTHASTDRPSRFSDGSYGVLYIADRFEVALFETIHHHIRFMRATREPPGWTSQFRELVLDVDGELHDLAAASPAVFDPIDYAVAQAVAAELHRAGGEGVLYPSVRHPDGLCVGLFYPDLARHPVQGRHLDYHWNGERVDFYRDAGSRAVFAIEAQTGDLQ